jgi:hypothetical protein
MAVDPRRMRHRPGTRFVKLLGTGRGSRFGAGQADLTRWAAITVTDGAAPEFPQWARIASAACRIDLRPLASRGSWAGAEPFTPAGTEPETRPGVEPSGPARAGGAGRNGAPAARWDGMVLALTRARLRPTRALTFWRAIARVAAPLARTPGLLAAFGIGEAPVGWQGTVSLWRGAADLAAFAYRQPEHRRAIERTPTVGWYAEELFARFAVLGVTGDTEVIGCPAYALAEQPALDGSDDAAGGVDAG